MSNYIFVYGTLRKGCDNPMSIFLKKHAIFHQKGRLTGELYDVGEYPAGVYDEESKHEIVGDIFEITDAATLFETLDPYEDVEDELYSRVIRPVFVTNQNYPLSCWVYVYNCATFYLPLITHGDYLLYLSEKNAL